MRICKYIVNFLCVDEFLCACIEFFCACIYIFDFWVCVNISLNFMCVDEFVFVCARDVAPGRPCACVCLCVCVCVAHRG